MTTETVETLVIGGGVSGLTYAHARGPRADLLVCEASSRSGGLVWTDADSLQGARFERGPEALQVGKAATAEMLRELELELLPPRAEVKRRYLVRDGALHAVPSGPGALLRTPLLSARGKLRLLTEPWRKGSIGLDGSVADFARHRLGPEALDYLVDPLIGGIHAGNPEQLSARACFPALIDLVEQHGSLIRGMFKRRGSGGAPALGLVRPRGGMGALPAALAAALGSRLRLESPVERLERDARGWLAHTPQGSVLAQRLVLALPAAGAARLLSGVAPRIAAAAGEIHSESLISIALVFPREAVAHALDGFGCLVPSREGLQHLGTLFSSSIDASLCTPQRVVLRVLAGGARHPQLAAAPEAAIWERILGEVTPLLGLAGEPLARHLTRWPATLPRYDLQHPARVERIERDLPAHPGLHLLGNWLRGIGLDALVARARFLAREHTTGAT